MKYELTDRTHIHNILLEGLLNHSTRIYSDISLFTPHCEPTI